MPTTTRWGLRYPAGTDAADVPLSLQRLATDLDGVAMDDQGLLSGRPASSSGSPGKRGRYYFATDEGTLYRDNGAGWDAVGGAALNPPGTILATARASAPSGFLICDGAAVSRTTYAALYAAIGTAYGSGNGSTTFNLPDLRGRTPVGLGTHADANSLADSDGLAVGSRTPKHSHTNPSMSASTANITVDSGPDANVSVARSDHGHTLGSTGQAGPAFAVVNYLIKT